MCILKFCIVYTYPDVYRSLAVHGLSNCTLDILTTIIIINCIIDGVGKKVEKLAAGEY